MSKSKDNWNPCNGELDSLVAKLQGTPASGYAISRRAWLGAVIATGVGAGLFTNRGEIMAATMPPMSCNELRDCADAILADTTDATTAARVRHHLAKCPSCVYFLEKARHEANDTCSGSLLPSV